MRTRQLPARPDVQQLKHQAKDLFRAIRRGDAAATAEWRAHHPRPTHDPTSLKLADAQLVLARSYGAASWPRLIRICKVIEALWRGDMDTARKIVAAAPDLMSDAGMDAENGLAGAVIQAARHSLERTIATLQAGGVRDITTALRFPELRPAVDGLRLLGRLGAHPHPDVVAGAVELLQGADFAFMIEMGAPIADRSGDWRPVVALALETYARNPEGKHRILETLADRGIAVPDTSPIAVHRGRLDLLERHLARDPKLLQRTFTHQQIFPPELGCHVEESLALTAAPCRGATLLHLAAEYEEVDLVRWLLERGMDPNVRARTDDDRRDGHTALFHCVAYAARKDEAPVAHLLLERGAEPNARASIRMQLPFANHVHEYRDVTPMAWALQFGGHGYACPAARRIIAEHGGRE